MWIYGACATLAILAAYLEHQQRAASRPFSKALLLQMRRVALSACVGMAMLSLYQLALHIGLAGVNQESELRAIETAVHAVNSRLDRLRAVSKVSEFAALVVLFVCGLCIPAIARLALIAKFKRYTPYLEGLLVAATVVASFSVLSPVAQREGAKIDLALREWARDISHEELVLRTEVERLVRSIAAREVASEWKIAPTLGEDLGVLRSLQLELDDARSRLARAGHRFDVEPTPSARVAELASSTGSDREPVQATAEKRSWSRGTLRSAVARVKAARAKEPGLEGELYETVEKGAEAVEASTVKPLLAELFQAPTGSVPTELADVIVEALCEQALREAMKLGARSIVEGLVRDLGGLESAIAGVRHSMRTAIALGRAATRERAEQSVKRLREEIGRGRLLLANAKRTWAGVVLALELSILEVEATSKWGALRHQYLVAVDEGRVNSTSADVVVKLGEPARDWDQRRRDLAKTWASEGTARSAEEWERAYVDFLEERPERLAAWGWIVKDPYAEQIKVRYSLEPIPRLGVRFYGEETGLLSEEAVERLFARKDVIRFIIDVCLKLGS
jgi:hypothetical protein